ncbi:hypothetical protein NMY22_g17617 [Coprinellus aureogranulatus]|nr:hypothetical protein NMY22_g17617 [Coprinellus aureogranulatus]
MSSPRSKRAGAIKGRKFYFGDEANRLDGQPADLVDLAVLTFPHPEVSRFKLSHLLVRCTILKKGDVSTKRTANFVVEFKTHVYGIRAGLVNRISPEARSRDTAYAYGLLNSF